MSWINELSVEKLEKLLPIKKKIEELKAREDKLLVELSDLKKEMQEGRSRGSKSNRGAANKVERTVTAAEKKIGQGVETARTAVRKRLKKKEGKGKNQEEGCEEG